MPIVVHQPEGFEEVPPDTLVREGDQLRIISCVDSGFQPPMSSSVASVFNTMLGGDSFVTVTESTMTSHQDCPAEAWAITVDMVTLEGPVPASDFGDANFGEAIEFQLNTVDREGGGSMFLLVVLVAILLFLLFQQR